eukprot:1353298-Rhodomonas_salina.2
MDTRQELGPGAPKDCMIPVLAASFNCATHKLVSSDSHGQCMPRSVEHCINLENIMLGSTRCAPSRSPAAGTGAHLLCRGRGPSCPTLYASRRGIAS